MKEVWKDIAGYEGLYQISNLGNVKSLNYNHTGNPKLLSIKNGAGGYKFVTLCNNGVHKNRTIHILVAKAFIENKNSKPCVNHINGDKSNNTVKNLEWVAYSENTRHAIRTNLRADSYMRGVKGKNNPNSLQVYQFDKNGNFIRKWYSISDAARHFDCNPCTIVNCCAGRIKSCKGYIWKYEGE